jgi:hypothetical protein
MGFPLAEVLRIGATVAGAAVGGPLGGVGAAALTGLANEMDKEDDPETPKAIREMKQKRRKRWVEFATDAEKAKHNKLKRYPEAAHHDMGKVLSAAAGADLRALIKGDILETEDRIPGEQEVNIYAEAVSAAARRKL